MTETKDVTKLMAEAEKNYVPVEAFEARPEDGGYEKQDVNSRFLVVAFIVGTVVIGVIMFLIAQYVQLQREAEIVANVNAVESASYRDVRAKEEEKLASYKYDPKTGFYQIPISKSMELIADEAHDRKMNALNAKSDAKPDEKKVDPKKPDGKTKGKTAAKKTIDKK
jgi:hypothetical protein